MSRSLLELLAKVWLVWIWGYFILGAVSLANRGTSFLAAPVDTPFPVWFKLTFLNFPLQMGLAFSASYLLSRQPDDPPSNITIVFSVAATALIATNFAIAIWQIL